ncbi:MAG TPA: site-2 protease family protein [Isosphaeraceae bacterium]|jgi:Zn-dependent protease|nr:site-2 protease family protein [Isosphaeraceae bacterium]
MADELRSRVPLLAHNCTVCGSEIAPTLLSCPSCHRLVHGARLKELAADAEAAEKAGELSAALAFWNEAVSLLPAESRQYAAIADRIAMLGRRVEAGPKPPAQSTPTVPHAKPTASSSSPWSGGALSGIAATLALLAWKFKFLAVLLLTKGKILLLGLTKASTFLSMFVSMGMYWTVFGGWFAAGLVLSIYVHEMGHVVALSRYGIHAGAPLFVPGLGAFIRLRQELTDPKQDARVGLAGPFWGLGAALVCLAAYVVTRQPILAALAQFGAIINLFNLLPIWHLDGGRAFRSLTRSQRWLAVAAIAAAWAITDEGLLVLLLLGGIVRTLMDKPSDKPDPSVVGQYAILIWILAALTRLPVPLPG